MQRQRGELVPMGDALADLGGPVEGDPRRLAPGVATTSPEADQVNQLVSSQRSGPRSGLHGANDGAVLVAPHQPRQPPPVQARQRPLQARHVRQAVITKLPYGNLPRLLIAWLSYRSGTDPKPARFVLGAVALPSSCGNWASIPRAVGNGGMRTLIRNQMKRLFGCSGDVDLRGRASFNQRQSSHIAERTEFWWNERKPDEPSAVAE